MPETFLLPLGVGVPSLLFLTTLEKDPLLLSLLNLSLFKGVAGPTPPPSPPRAPYRVSAFECPELSSESVEVAMPPLLVIVVKVGNPTAEEGNELTPRAMSPPEIGGDTEDPPEDPTDPPECEYSPEIESELEPTEETLTGEEETGGLTG